MTREINSNRLKLWCIVFVVTSSGFSPQIIAQSTYTYSTTSTSTAWLNASNWKTTGGATSTKFPGVDNYATSTADGNTGDRAVFGTLAISATPALVGINFNNTASSNGLTTNSNANGSLALGAIEASSDLNKALNIGKSDTSTFAANLTLNGFTVNNIDNVILRNNSASALTIAPFAGGSGTAGMQIVLGGGTDNVINADSTGSITVGAVIKNGGGFKLTIGSAGTGAVTLSNTNLYSGGTAISSGKLLATGGSSVNATATGSGLVSVNGGTLGGTGYIGPVSVNAGGNITANDAAPAATSTQAIGSTGTLHTGALTLSSGGTYTADVGSATSKDLIDVNGALDLSGLSDTAGGRFTVRIVQASGTSSASNPFTIVQGNGTVALPAGIETSNVANISKFFELPTINGHTYTLQLSNLGGGTFDGSNGFAVQASETSDSPEPGTAMLFGTGVSALLLTRRRRQASEELACG